MKKLKASPRKTKVNSRSPSPRQPKASPTGEHVTRKRKRDDESTIVLHEGHEGHEDLKKVIVRGKKDGASTSNSSIVPTTRKDVISRTESGDEIDDASAVCLKTRMSPKLLLTFINNHMSDQQKSDIESMGFGGLLLLKTNMVPGMLSYWLVSTFNTCSLSLMDEKLLITEEDIHLATGIPMGPTEIELATLCDTDEDFVELRGNWLRQFGPSHTKVKTQDFVDWSCTVMFYEAVVGEVGGVSLIGCLRQWC